jgi:hypothetical protein
MLVFSIFGLGAVFGLRWSAAILIFAFAQIFTQGRSEPVFAKLIGGGHPCQIGAPPLTGPHLLFIGPRLSRTSGLHAAVAQW